MAISPLRFGRLSVVLLTLTVSAGRAAAAEPEARVAALPTSDGSPATSESPPADIKNNAEPTVTSVPLARVILFSSGVGFFDRQGQVDGNASVAIKFNAGDINDLLKSLVVEDRGGQIAAVTYGSKDPITKTLSKFAINLTSNPTLAQILNQIRGERIEFSAPGPMAGTLLGVETRRRQVEKDQPPIEVEILNVLSDDGLRSIPLDQVGTIKLTNAQLDKEFRQALAVLALGHDAEKKSVSLRFTGQGRRPVRVGYIQNTPIWKTSYRLVLADDGQPKLQGWAIVENTTEEDWHDVQLTLVSGRPVSFIMNLYDPLYVQRPLVQPDLFAGLRPQVYGQALAGARLEQLDRRARDTKHFGRNGYAEPADDATENSTDSLAESAGHKKDHAEADGLNGPVPDRRFAKRKEIAYTIAKPVYAFTPGAMSAASAADVGELFQYRIGPPVSLNRQESAMLPIVDQEVAGTKLSIYNPAVQLKHPLCGLRLKNTTELHLMQGPITVFDGGSYAGDARIEDIAPGGERLLTYSLDLDVEVAQTANGEPDEITSIRLIKGMIKIQHKAVRSKTYTLKNSGQKDRKILVEQPIDQQWQLVTPKEPTEKAAEIYRFAVDVPAGKSAELKITEERVYAEELAIQNVAIPTIRFFQSQRTISEKARHALEQIVEMQTHISSLAEARKQLEAQLKNIGEEQNRIRQNMQQLDRNSDLYKRYVKKFGEQEDAVETLRHQIDKQTADEADQQKVLDKFLMSLDLE